LYPSTRDEALLFRRTGRGSIHDGARLVGAFQKIHDPRLAPLEPDRPPLHRERVTEPVDDEPRQPVALGMDAAQARRVWIRKALRRPSLDRHANASLEQRRVHRLIRSAREQTHQNGGPGGIQATAQHSLFGIANQHFVACCGLAVDASHGLGEHPGVACPDGLNVAGLERDLG
jgi:hypothetical protein